MDYPRLRRVVAAATAVVAAAGCQSYEAAPFDADRFAQVWRERAADQGSVTALAARVAASRQTTVPTFSLADGLTIDEAQALASLYNPALRIARRRAGVTRARAAHAGHWQDPTLGIDAERILGGVDEPWVLGGTLGLTLPVSGRLEVERSRARAEHGVELLRVAGQEWSTRHRLLETWAEWSTQAMRVELIDALIARLDEINRVADRLANGGAIPRVSARLFRLERATRRAERVAAGHRLSELRLAIHSAIGLVPDAPITLVPSMASDPAAGEARLPARQSYEVRVATATYEVAERTLEREVRAQYPDVVIGPGFGTDEGDERVLLGLSLPIPLWNRNRQGIAEATAGRDLARVELEVAIETAAAALAAARAQRVAAVAQRDAYRDAIAPLADEQVAEVVRLGELGEVDGVLWVDAFVRQYEAKLGVLDAQLAVVRADARLAETSGDPAAATAPVTDTEGDR